MWLIEGKPLQIDIEISFLLNPSFEPWRILPGQRAMRPNDRTDISWETMASNQMAKMKLIKDAREKLRKNEMDG